MSESTKRAGLVVLVAASYALIGLTTATLARAGAAPAWRMAAWLLALVVFVAQVLHGRLRFRDPAVVVAVQAAAAAAVGALALAALGPVRSHWSSTDLGRVALLSLAVWPVMTAVPAFIASLVLTALLDHVVDRRKPNAPPPAT